MRDRRSAFPHTDVAQYASVQSELSETLNEPLMPPSQTKLVAMQRHRELLLEFQRDFGRSKTSLQQAMDRKQLLGNVKEDIKCVLLPAA